MDTFSVGMIFIAVIGMMITWIAARNSLSAQAAPLPKQIDADKLSVGEVVITAFNKMGNAKLRHSR